jgi:DNA-binding beta-propeller fold protein YncE
MRAAVDERTLAVMSIRLGLLILGAALAVGCGARGPAAVYFEVRDDTALPAGAPDATVIALTNGHYLTLVPGNAGPSRAQMRWRFRPELSYRPASPALLTGPFVHLDVYFVRPGDAAEAEALASQHAAIDRDVGVRHAWDIFTTDDSSGPVLVQRVRARSRGDYEREKAAAEALRGQRIRPLYERVSKLVRKVSSLEGRELDLGYRREELPLPGATGLVTLDYLAWDRATGRLWVPAGNTGRIDVIEGGAVRSIGGLATAAFEYRGKRGVLGPSSVSIGDGVVYVGNRADRTICVVDAVRVALDACIAVASPDDGWAAAPDAVVYVPTTRELWVTRGAPPLGIPSSDRAIAIFDASAPAALRPSGSLPLGASAEGYAVDPGRGVFYTNLEETGETIAIDARTREIRARWRSGCGEPHGLAIDRSRGLVFVACDDRVIALDARGAVVGTIETGSGVDNIDYLETRQLLFVAASEAATLTIARVDADGRLAHVATIPTARGARVVVAALDGTAYVADPVGGQILKIHPDRIPAAIDSKR